MVGYPFIVAIGLFDVDLNKKGNISSLRSYGLKRLNSEVLTFQKEARVTANILVKCSYLISEWLGDD